MRITVVAPLGIAVPKHVSFSPLASDDEIVSLNSQPYSLLDLEDSVLEIGLRLKETRPGSTVRLFAVGPSSEVDNSVRHTLIFGYDEARILVIDAEDWQDCRRFARLVLPEIEKDKCDVVLMSERPEGMILPHVYHHLTGLLGLPCLPTVKSVQWSGDDFNAALEIRLELDTALIAATPCVISMFPNTYQRRHGTLKRIMANRHRRVEIRAIRPDGTARTNGCEIPPCRGVNPRPGSLAKRYHEQSIWSADMAETYVPLAAGESLIGQIRGLDVELDQRLTKAVCAAGDWASHVRAGMASETLSPLELFYINSPNAIGGMANFPVFPKGAGELRDNDVITYLLGREPSILNTLTSAISDTRIRKAFEEWMLSNSRILAALAPSQDHEGELAADTTARIFSRAAYQARLQHHRTLSWQDLLRSTIDVGAVLVEDQYNRPLFIDSLMEMISGKRNRNIHEVSDVTQLLKEIRAAIPEYEGDFQYVMVLEDDKIALRVCSHVGDFVQRREKQIYIPHRGLLLHHDDNYWDFSTETLAELNQLLRDPRAGETEFQRFFERNPGFFRKFDVREVYPLVHLTTRKGDDLVPDFLLTNRAIQKAMIVELKLPSAKLVVHRDNRIRFGRAVMEARAQLLTYRRWFEDSEHRDRLSRVVGMPIYHPRLAVIIGRTSEFYDGIQRQTLAADTPDIDVVTYDDMTAFAEYYRSRVRTIWLKHHR